MTRDGRLDDGRHRRHAPNSLHQPLSLESPVQEGARRD
jgi:hypothetical protein